MPWLDAPGIEVALAVSFDLCALASSLSSQQGLLTTPATARCVLLVFMSCVCASVARRCASAAEIQHV